jgi:S-adenosylmethionine:tRNA ribosyltransferase-isomerase
MDISFFDYELPPDLIAQEPPERRDQSKLMLVDRSSGQIEHHSFSDLPELLNAKDCLIVNNTKVFKARLIGHRESGGEVEIFLVRPVESDQPAVRWLALVRPSRRLSPNENIRFQDAGFVRLVENRGGGNWLVEAESSLMLERIVEQSGHVPLPQYIKRPDREVDISRYQTIFARSNLARAVAAPTAGFHFTEAIVDRLKSRGNRFGEVTLHVGPGTFKPVTVESIEDHLVDPEVAELQEETCELISSVQSRGGKVTAVGTTVCRTLESADIENGALQPFARVVDLYIRPGYQFHVVDQLVTNFHLPKSSLLILVSALAGRELILEAYSKAIENRYRFYSYGDAMLIR